MSYEDIIHLSRPKSKHKPSTMLERAGQFMPFSALKAYDECVALENRYVEDKIQLSDDQKLEINDHLNRLVVGDNLKLIYFKKDLEKAGGLNLEYSGIFKKLDIYNRQLIFEDGFKLKIDDIYQIISD